MTPDASSLCVFAIKRGFIRTKRCDVNGTLSRIVHTQIYRYPTKALSELVDSFSGGTPSKNNPLFWEGNIPWVSPKDFKTFYISDSEDHISSEAIQESATRIVPEGNVLVVVRSGILKHTLPVGVTQKSVTINQDIKALVVRNGISAEFLGFFLKTFEQQILELCVKHSTTVQSINTKEFFELRIPVPSLSEQCQFVDNMQKALSSRKDKLNLADELLAGISTLVLDRLGISFDISEDQVTFITPFANILGNRLDADYHSPRFSQFRKQIEESPYSSVSIAELSEKITSGFAAGKQDQADNMPDDKRVPHLRPFSITPEGELSFDTMKYVPKSKLKNEDYCRKNEVIFNNTNSPDLVGKTTVFDSDVLCAASNHMTRITIKDGVNPYYVAAFFNVLLSTGYWKLLCTNFNNQAGVNTETLKNVKIPLPPKEIQDDIARAIMQRRVKANALRKEAEEEWRAAKEQFKKLLLEM